MSLVTVIQIYIYKRDSKAQFSAAFEINNYIIKNWSENVLKCLENNVSVSIQMCAALSDSKINEFPC